MADYELVPIYRTLTPKTSNISLNVVHDFNKIYEAAYQVVNHLNDQHLNDLIRLTQHVNLDKMGKYAYERNKEVKEILLRYCSNDKKLYIPLVFSCLKRYFNTLQSLPITSTSTKVKVTDVDNKLLKALNISVEIEVYHGEAYQALKSSLIKLPDVPLESIKMFNQMFYDDAKILFEKSNASMILHATLLTIDQAAYLLLIHNGTTEDLFNLVDMIEKEMTHGITEKDIGYKLLSNTLYSNEAKNRMALFLHLVKQYRQRRGDRLTPCARQYYTYLKQKKLNILLPDSFNTSFFNTNCYAFDDFKLLRKNTVALMQSDVNSVQTCVNQIYN